MFFWVWILTLNWMLGQFSSDVTRQIKLFAGVLPSLAVLEKSTSFNWPRNPSVKLTKQLCAWRKHDTCGVLETPLRLCLSQICNSRKSQDLYLSFLSSVLWLLNLPVDNNNRRKKNESGICKLHANVGLRPSLNCSSFGNYFLQCFTCLQAM